MGEFEFALMFYHKGQKLRPQIEEFRLGIQKATKAIEDTIGNVCSSAEMCCDIFVIFQNSSSTCPPAAANIPGPPNVNLEIKGDFSFLQNDDEVSLCFKLHSLPGEVSISGIGQNQSCFSP